MQHILHLKCLICGQEYAPNEIDYICPDHGREGILDVCYDYEYLRAQIDRDALTQSREYSIWRYKALLPVLADAPTPPLQVGWTPLYQTPRLASRIGLRNLWVKDDGRNPTASFKDRASAIAVMKAGELQGARGERRAPRAPASDGLQKPADEAIRTTQYAIPIITTASTGNAAAALSGLCASIGQPNVIFVPKNAPQAKIAQLLVFGSTVLLVDGTYDDAFELCLEAADLYGWYNRNTGFNPYMTEGKKTVSYEICEQLAWDAPDVIFVSVGDGCIIGGVHKGLKDLLALGWIDKMPRLIGVQANGSSYLADAWINNEDVLTKSAIIANTVADSISAGLPRDRIKAMAAVRETHGAFVTVSDEEILAAIPTLAREVAVFAEPAGAAAYAGLTKAAAQGLVSADERIVVINTGNGLKDVQSAMQAVAQVGTSAHLVAPEMKAVGQILGY